MRCEQKVRYPDEAAAWEGIAEITVACMTGRYSGQIRQPVWPSPCHRCNGWHIVSDAERTPRRPRVGVDG